MRGRNRNFRPARRAFRQRMRHMVMKRRRIINITVTIIQEDNQRQEPNRLQAMGLHKALLD